MVNVPHRTGLNRRVSAGRDGSFDGLLGVWTFIAVFTAALGFGFAFDFALAFGLAFGFAFGFAFAFAFVFAFAFAVGIVGGVGNGWPKQGVSKVSLLGVAEPPMDDSSCSGTGGSSEEASLRIPKWDDTVLVDSAVGAAVLLCDAAMVVCVAVSVGAAKGRSCGPGAEGDSEPLGGDCCIKPVAAGKAPYWPSTPRASVSASLCIGPSPCIFAAGEHC